MICEYRDILRPKDHTKKIDKIHKGFGLYQVFMHNFMCQNVRYLQIKYCRHVLKAFLPFPNKFFINFY